MRVVYLDHSRVVGAYLVILGHLLPYDNICPRLYIYSFHMALFFIISGLLHKEKGVLQISKFFKALVIPAIFFNILLWVLEGPFWQYGIWNFYQRYGVELPNSIFATYRLTFIQMIYSFVRGSIAPSGPCWFLISLFICKCIINMMSQIKHSGWVILGVTILGFVLFTLPRIKMFFLGSTFMAFPFFFLGYLMKDKLFVSIKKMCVENRFLVGLLGFIMMLLLSYYNGKVSVWGIKFGVQTRLISIPLFYIVGFLGSISVIMISSCIEKFFDISNKIANSLITILGFQLFLIYFGWYNFLTISKTPLLSVLLSFPILYICYVVHNIISNYIPFVIGKNKI